MSVRTVMERSDAIRTIYLIMDDSCPEGTFEAMTNEELGEFLSEEVVDDLPF